MAPGYRPNNRRQNRGVGYVDHDVFEGLPVRHWRRELVTVAPPPPSQDNPASQNDVWAVELPYGMPKDSHLLSQHSQDLLRAARSGRIYKRPAPPEEEETDAEAILGDKAEKREDDHKNAGFTARAWKLIPRHLEGPDVEYLAKRRKGIVTITKKSANSAPTVMTKATVKRMDAAGNEYVQDVVVPQGHPVDGEVLSQRVIQDPNSASGDGLLVPSKRKIPPPRKKSKGTGKSKKKKLNPPTSVPVASGASEIVEGAAAPTDPTALKIETQSIATTGEDTEMADGSAVASDDEEGDEGEDGEEGDEEEESERTPVDKSISPKAPQPLLQAPEITATTDEATAVENQGTSVTDFATIDPTATAPVAAVLNAADNAAMTAVAVSPPSETPEITPAPVTVVGIGSIDAVDTAMQSEVAETAPTTLPPPPPGPTIAETKAAVEVRQEEEEEEEMLLDIVENAENAKIGGGNVPPLALADSEPPVAEAAVAEIQLPEIAPKEADPMAEPELEPATEPELEPVTAPPAEPATGLVTDPATEPVTESAPEPIPELAAQPATEPATEPAMEPAAEEPTTEEPTAEEPSAESAAEPATEPESAQPTAEEVKTDAAQPVQEDDFPDLLGGLEKQLNESAPEKTDV